MLDIVWEGSNSTNCDGNVLDFSLLSFLASSDVKTIPGKKLSIKQLLFNNYESQANSLNFWFQYKFRRESVEYIYYRELFCACGIAFAFQWINFQYLHLFAKSGYTNLTPVTAQEAYLNNKIDDYKNINFMGTIFAATMIYSVI